MTAPISVLHLTAHLGGGVGKALSGLILNTPPDSGIRHEIACLEQPEKSQFLDQLADAGCPVTIAPDHDTLARRLDKTDIVQLEWWGHPALPAALCRCPLPPMRLLVWCHVSGIHTPIIPGRLIEASHAAVFTSPCSYEADETRRMPPDVRAKTGVIHSSGGFSDLPTPDTDDSPAQLTAGYLGSLNFAKLHPRVVEFLAAVPIPGFTVRMTGDTTNKDVLEKQCRQVGRPGLLEFRGYTTDIAGELAAINIFPYLLNPRHYGTSENALLEAMAMGIVPIVLDNPPERCLVTDRKTGIIVRTPREFAEAVSWLERHPAELLRLSSQASKAVRERFCVSHAVTAFSERYTTVTGENKRAIPFAGIFGPSPADWFLSIQRHPELFSDGPVVGTVDEFTLHGLFEKTKGSVFHYSSYFPHDERLTEWVRALEAQKNCLHEIPMRQLHSISSTKLSE